MTESEVMAELAVLDGAGQEYKIWCAHLRFPVRGRCAPIPRFARDDRIGRGDRIGGDNGTSLMTESVSDRSREQQK
jgi:hypothetical protein